MISYVKYAIFPGDDNHVTPSRTYPHIGGCSPRPGRRSSARHPMLNTNRPHAFNHWCVVPPSASEHFWLLALSSGTPYRSRWRRRHPRKSSAAQATEDLLIDAVILWQTHVLSCVLLLYCFIYCITVVIAVFLLGSLFKILFDWLNDWLKQTLLCTRRQPLWLKQLVVMNRP